jgi:hypothetical protein
MRRVLMLPAAAAVAPDAPERPTFRCRFLGAHYTFEFAGGGMGARGGKRGKPHGARPRKTEEYPSDVAEFLVAKPPKPDWEALIEEGTVPALILGAERRLRKP